MDRQLLSQVDASALFCCDIIWDFKGSKAQTVKINFFPLFQEVKKTSLSLIYENISSEEAAKQQARRQNSRIKHRQHADKEANVTVLKENRSQGEQEVTPRLVLHSADVLSLLSYSCNTKHLWCWEHWEIWCWEEKWGARSSLRGKKPLNWVQVPPFPAGILPILEKISSKKPCTGWNCSRASLSP